jgi:hypothetical protein
MKWLRFYSYYYLLDNAAPQSTVILQLHTAALTSIVSLRVVISDADVDDPATVKSQRFLNIPRTLSTSSPKGVLARFIMNDRQRDETRRCETFTFKSRDLTDDIVSIEAL